MEEARVFLMDELQETISLGDVYRLVLSGNITVSAKFHHMIDVVVGYDVTGEALASNELDGIFTTPGGTKLCFSKKVERVAGLWDLTLLGREFADLHKAFKYYIGDVAGLTSSLNGVLLKQGNKFCLLQADSHRIRNTGNVINGFDSSPFKKQYENCISLDYYAHEIVVKTSEVIRFAQSLDVEANKEDMPLASRERNTLLILIGALCKQLDICPSARGVTASVQAMTELTGAPLSDDSIRKILTQVEPALERRQK